MIPPTTIAKSLIVKNKDYLVRLAETEEDLMSVFRLRFEVFNLELGRESSTSNLIQIDRDKFDDVCHHLMVIAKNTGQTIGTYRIQTYEMAGQGVGFYCSQFFNLNTIPDSVLQAAVETGRACVAKEYRHSRVLFLLWKGIIKYSILNGKRYCFGYTGLSTLTQANCAYHYFQKQQLMHPSLLVYPHPQCHYEISQNLPSAVEADIPNLLRAYLRIGAKIWSLPAINLPMKTIGFLTVLDIASLEQRYYKMLCGE
jgi:putative hemolysin